MCKDGHYKQGFKITCLLLESDRGFLLEYASVANCVLERTTETAIDCLNSYAVESSNCLPGISSTWTPIVLMDHIVEYTRYFDDHDALYVLKNDDDLCLIPSMYHKFQWIK